MTERGKFPDAEQVMREIAAPFGYACTVLPVDPDDPDGRIDESKFPIILIARNGGSRDEITDRPILQVGVLARTRSESWRVADDVRDAVFASPGTAPGGDLVDSAREITGVSQLPDIDPQNRLVEAVYALSFRRKR